MAAPLASSAPRPSAFIGAGEGWTAQDALKGSPDVPAAGACGGTAHIGQGASTSTRSVTDPRSRRLEAVPAVRSRHDEMGRQLRGSTDDLGASACFEQSEKSTGTECWCEGDVRVRLGQPTALTKPGASSV